ncbi:MAG: glycosyltransferase [Alphaproteobacteria bacterium]|nr:glycosyltransferase [Alphaproteobacteria bacterium]
MLAVVGAISLAIWAYLLLGRRRFWRADQRLPQAGAGAPSASVLAVVPARDEAAVIGDSVAGLLAQDYPGPLRIVVVDDGSTDGTAELARMAAAGHDRPLEIVSGRPLPAGWSGKLWALQTGLEHADRTGPATDFIWFSDADIDHHPDVLRRLAALAETRSLALVSVMARLHCAGVWERLLVPAFVFFFQMLYPFPAVNDPRSPVAGAAGGCILLRREALERAGGLASMRDALIDDCALAARVKGAGGRLWLGFEPGVRSRRESNGLRDLWLMVSRTAFTQLRYSGLLLVLVLAGLALTFLVPPLLLLTWPLHRDGLATLLGAAGWAAMSAAYAPTLAEYGRRPGEALALPATAALYGAMTLHSALNHWRGATSRWKGREYQKSHTRGRVG